MSLFAVFGLGAVLSAVVLMGAGALMDDAAHPAEDAAEGRSPAPLRVLMAPGGTAVALPEFVTAPDGEVRARWSDAEGLDGERRAA
jgi:hypothetical protein